MKRKSVAFILATGLVLSGGAVHAQTTAANPTIQYEVKLENKLLKKISADNMYNTIALLSKEP